LFLSIYGIAFAEYEHVHRCDQIGAHFDDIQKWAKGMTEDELAPQLAIKFCSLAVKEHPDTGRFYFQLGRAYWKAEQYHEAVDHLIKAFEMDHAAAAAYLGEAYSLGLGGYEVDVKTAREFYEAAALGGFEVDTSNLAGSNVKQEGFNPEVFERPEIIKALESGDFSALSEGKFWTILYLTKFNQFFKDQKDYSFYQDVHEQNPAACGLLYEPELTKTLAMKGTFVDNPIMGNASNDGEALNNIAGVLENLLKDFTSQQQGTGRRTIDGIKMTKKLTTIELDLEVLKESAEKDAFRLSTTFGCESDIIKRVYVNIWKFTSQ